MMNIAVIYKSKYGTTKQYAQWISEELKCDLFEISEINVSDLLKYDVIIFGGGLYAGGINGIAIITKNFEKLKDKNLIIFTVGLANPQIKEQFKPIIDKSFTDAMKTKLSIYHFRGGIDYSKLGFAHKSMMAMLKTMVSKKNANELTDEDKQMLETYGQKVDFTDKTSIEPLTGFVRNLTK